VAQFLKNVIVAMSSTLTKVSDFRGAQE
jgi:hypothetical protein